MKCNFKESVRRHDSCRYHSGMSGVVLTCLDCFLFGRITSTLTKQPWCAAAASDLLENVIRLARELLKDGFGDYDVIRNNCEHFSLLCKTGGSCKWASRHFVVCYVGISGWPSGGAHPVIQV
ncbi:hypothetical protein SUGI_0300590 [Cryptomeria japonica]|nr:hypothetical protein SUGI_0300590 [Cryptomeria japonica]